MRSLHAFLALAISCPLAAAAGIEVNGGFEAGDATGWTEWQSPWALEVAYDYAFASGPFEGTSSMKMAAERGSFGVYQEFCVEPGIAFNVAWAWKGATTGPNGWWELLIIDAPYSYDLVDINPLSHPETHMIAKWEVGFGGPYPEPSPDWEQAQGEIVPTSDVVTVVLKCGASPGPVEASFDAVTVTHASSLLALTEILPAAGKAAGGTGVTVNGRNFPPDSVLKIGGKDLVGQLRSNTCTITGLTPPGDPGPADVTLVSARGTATLPGAFRYIAPPAITAIDPARGPLEGGTAVAITGQGFEGTPITVAIGGKPLVSPNVVDATTITGSTPPHEAGTADVVVRTPYGEETLAGAFRYGAGPTIAAIVPNQGPVEGGTAVTITGQGFEGTPITVAIGGNPLGSQNVVDPTTITGTTPAHEAGPADVVVTTPDGEATLAGGFTYGSTAPTFKRGDCNEDGTVNIADAISLLGILFAHKPRPGCYEACNGNDDATVNIADAVKILSHLFAKTGPLPDPFSACGPDPTPTPESPCGAKQPQC